MRNGHHVKCEGNAHPKKKKKKKVKATFPTTKYVDYIAFKLLSLQIIFPYLPFHHINFFFFDKTSHNSNTQNK